MSTPSSNPSQKKAAEKRALILEVAADLIIEQGYNGTNLDAICERAACSKSSIYEIFGNKEGLLAALTEDIAVELSRALHAFHLQHLSVEETLRRYARLALELILTERHIAIVQAVISSVWKHPQLGPVYYKIGALTGQAALRQYIQTHVESGDLLVEDPEWAAEEFQAILLWDRFFGRIVGAKSNPSRAEIKHHADRVVDAFLAQYGRPPSVLEVP